MSEAVRHGGRGMSEAVRPGGRGMHLGATVNPAPPSRAGREMDPGVHQAGREISSDDDGDAVGVEDAARDRTVRRPVAPRQIAGRRRADTPGTTNSPE
jgi:hypothetical protein